MNNVVFEAEIAYDDRRKCEETWNDLKFSIIHFNEDLGVKRVTAKCVP